MESKLKPGNPAPDFSLPSSTGKEISLSDFHGKKHVVLYFYPKDETPGCTAQACTFRDQYEVFKEKGAEVLGISSDSVESHQSFATHHKLPFTLLSDLGGQVRKLYGVSSTLGLLPGRQTFLIDKQGIVRLSFSSQLRPKSHIDQTLKMLETL